MIANHDLKHRCPHDKNKCPHCGTGEPEETTQTRPEPWMLSTTRSIDDWHRAKCISQWADKLHNENQCVSYLAAKYSLASDTPTVSPTLADLRQDCRDFQNHVNVDFLEDLCAASGNAMRTVWEGSYSRHRKESREAHSDQADHLEEASRQHPSGLVAIIKPLGWTSEDVCSRAKAGGGAGARAG